MIGEASIAGRNVSSFVITQDVCSGKSLGPSKTCSIALSFAPRTFCATSRAGDFAVLRLPSTDSLRPDATVSLLGTIEHDVDHWLTVEKSGNGTVASLPVGINCGTDCGESYPAGSLVTLTATPHSSSRPALQHGTQVDQGGEQFGSASPINTSSRKEPRGRGPGRCLQGFEGQPGEAWQEAAGRSGEFDNIDKKCPYVHITD